MTAKANESGYDPLTRPPFIHQAHDARAQRDKAQKGLGQPSYRDFLALSLRKTGYGVFRAFDAAL